MADPHTGDTRRRDTGDELANLFATRAPSGGVPPNDAFWGAVTREAEARGLCGLVLEHVAAANLDVPQQYTAHLRRGAARVAAEQLNMTHELVRVLTAFHQTGVPVMLLKGAALAKTCYAVPGLRPMSDLDLLVRLEHVAPATDVLERLRCRRGAALVRDDFFPRFYYETEWLTSSPRPVRIDLHARPFRPLRTSRTVPDDALWQNARRIEICSASAWVPTPEAMLIHLCAHAAYHGCSRLIWLYDVRRFVACRERDLDWSLVVGLCRRWKLSLPVRVALERCRQTVGLAFPDEVIAQLASHRVSWRDRLVLWQAPRDAERPLCHILVNAVSTPDAGLALRYLAACLRPGHGHLAALYPWRHWGWPVCAQLWRIVRAVGRLFVSALTGLRPSRLRPSSA